MPENNTIQYNIIVTTKKSNISIYNVAGGLHWTSSTKGAIIDHNLFYDPHTSLRRGTGRAGAADFPCTSNCTVAGHPNQWNPSGPYASWVQAGYDVHSMIDIDPLFTDPENGDFSLRAGSPAVKVGFIPLSVHADQC